MPRTGSESCLGKKKKGVQRTQKTIVENGMKTTRNGSSAAREPMFKTRNTSGNGVKITGDG